MAFKYLIAYLLFVLSVFKFSNKCTFIQKSIVSLVESWFMFADFTNSYKFCQSVEYWDEVGHSNGFGQTQVGKFLIICNQLDRFRWKKISIVI